MRTVLLAFFAALIAFSSSPSALAAGPQDGAETTSMTPEEAARAALEAEAKAYEESFSPALTGLLEGKVDAFSASVALPSEPVDTFQKRIDRAMGTVNGVIAGVFFYDVMGKSAEVDATSVLDDPSALEGLVARLEAEAGEAGFDFAGSAVTLGLPMPDATGDDRKATLSAKRSGIPLAVLWLVAGALFFTVRMGLVQLRALGHAVQVTRGKYDNPDDQGDVTSFQALSAALSATVGLGNIAGVAIAISVGGPGATFWMIMAGFLGMASKFTECSLGQMYRQERPDGSIMGGAMYYLSRGLADMGLGFLGKILAVFFVILCIGGSLGGGNTFQVNQSLRALAETIPWLEDHGWVYGVVMTVLVGAVILGGIKSIAKVAEKIVPTMCGVYVIACLIVILGNVSAVPGAFGTIIDGAFTPMAGFGGMIGVLVQGFKRAAFSNEAGVGSAAIAHSAAKTPYPVREGIVALLEPLIDTIIVCTMTALVIVITGAYQRVDESGSVTEFASYLENANGAGLTSQAFATTIPWFPYVLSVAVVLFAFSTMISWSYYGERCWVWLFNESSSIFYKIIFLAFVFMGSIITAQNVLDFGDLMILGMAIPNVLGVVLLSGKVKKALDEYMAKLKAGEMQTYD